MPVTVPGRVFRASSWRRQVVHDVSRGYASTGQETARLKHRLCARDQAMSISCAVISFAQGADCLSCKTNAITALQRLA